MNEVSQLMREAFSSKGCGAPSLDCTCGRTHHAPDSPEISPADAARMRAEARAYPKGFVIHEGVEFVTGVMVNSAVVVDGCECNWLARFEDHIWSEREQILRYYKARRDAELAALNLLDEVSQ